MGSDLVKSAGEEDVGGRWERASALEALQFSSHVHWTANSSGIKVHKCSQYWQISCRRGLPSTLPENVASAQEKSKLQCNIMHIHMLFIASPGTHTHKLVSPR